MTASHEAPTQKYPSGPEVGWWMGRLSELIRLGEAGEIPLHHNPVSTPVGACALAGALMYTSVIQGCLPLIHGPMGCANTYRVLFNFWPPVMGMAVPNFFSTALDEEDVIYGAEEKLRKAIRVADQVLRPELIAVHSSCASGIIGDNLESVCRQVEGEIQARLIWVATEGFGASYWGAAIDKVLMALVDRVMEEQPERDPYAVNVLGEKFADLEEFAYRTDTTELCQLLEAIGLRVCANLNSPILRKGHLFRPPFLAHPDYVLNCHLARHPASRCCQQDS